MQEFRIETLCQYQIATRAESLTTSLEGLGPTEYNVTGNCQASTETNGRMTLEDGWYVTGRFLESDALTQAA